MTVAEYVEQLQELPPDMEVWQTWYDWGADALRIIADELDRRNKCGELRE